MTPLIISFCILCALLCALITTDDQMTESAASAVEDPPAKKPVDLHPARNS